MVLFSKSILFFQKSKTVFYFPNIKCAHYILSDPGEEKTKVDLWKGKWCIKIKYSKITKNCPTTHYISHHNQQIKKNKLTRNVMFRLTINPQIMVYLQCLCMQFIKRVTTFTSEVSTGDVYAQVCKPNRSTAPILGRKRNEDCLLSMEVN